MPGPRRVLPVALPLLLALVAADAGAQTVQVTPFAGWAFGGSVRDTTFEEKRGLDAALSWGGTLDYAFSPHWRVELLYWRQPTKLEEGLGPSLDVTVERYMAGIQEEKGEGRARWFGTVWLGATRLVPGSGFGSTTHFGAGVGLGVKTFLAKHVGLRFEGRAFFTLVDGEGGGLCVNGECLYAFTGSSFWQGDFAGGVILAF